MKKNYLFILPFILLSIGSMSLHAGIYDRIRNLPSEAREHFPEVHKLPQGATIEWYHVLGFPNDHIPSDAEIRRAYLRLSRKVHPDKHGGADWATEAFQLVEEATHKKPANSDRVVIDNESPISKKKLVLSLLPKKFMIGTAVAATTAFALYQLSQTKWFKKHAQDLDGFLEEKSSALHSTLHVVVPAGRGTGKLAWGLTQIGGGLVLCIIGTPLILLGSATILVNPKNFEKEVGNDRIDMPPSPLTTPHGSCHIKQPDGSYHTYLDAQDYDRYLRDPTEYRRQAQAYKRRAASLGIMRIQVPEAPRIPISLNKICARDSEDVSM